MFEQFHTPMNKSKFSTAIAMVAFLATVVSSCAWHSMEEDVIPPPPSFDPCDTLSASFSDTILPILVASCSPAGSGQGCHLVGNNNRPEVSNYNDISLITDRIQARVINRDPSPMPPSGSPALSACQLELIQRWLDAGAPND